MKLIENVNILYLDDKDYYQGRGGEQMYRAVRNKMYDADIVIRIYSNGKMSLHKDRPGIMMRAQDKKKKSKNNLKR